MGSFLKVFETVGIDILKGAVLAGPPAVGAAATALGGPVAGAVAKSLINSIVQAEKNHLAVHGATGSTPAGIALSGEMDPRKTAVIQDFIIFLPVVEALAAATGFPIADQARFEAAIPLAVDASVQGLNAYAEVLASLRISSGAAPLPRAA